MKVFILCGGYGTRLDNLGKIIAKPMVRIGKTPLILHIIENYCIQGFNEFVICTGHKSNSINNFFLKEKKKYIKVIKKIKNHISIEGNFKKINLVDFKEWPLPKKLDKKKFYLNKKNENFF